MAEQDINVGINANTNFPSVVQKVVKSVDSLENSLGDLVGMLQDMARANGQVASSMQGVGASAKSASKNFGSSVKEVDRLRNALKETGRDADVALKSLDFSQINLKELSSAEIEDFGKALTEAGSSLGQFLGGEKIDLNFRPAIEQLNELQKLLGEPISTPDEFSGTKEVFAELRNLNQQLRTEIEDTLGRISVPDQALASVSQLREQIESLSGSSSAANPLALLADLGENRDEAIQTVQVIEELQQKLIALGPAAQSGAEGAVEEFKQLTGELDQAEKKAKQLTNILQDSGKVFDAATGQANQSLLSQGFKPITLEDIFPSAEQRKVDEMQRRIGTAVRESVQSGAVRQTLNLFKSGQPIVGELDRNIVQLTSHLPRMRYALYDVSNSLTVFGAGLLGASGAALKFSADFERAFADVARTTNLAGEEAAGEAQKLRRALIDITQDLPVGFEDVAQIATLAGQLNIANQSIGEFTESVAKFSATTDVTVDAAATAFGRLDQLVDGVNGQFEKLGSSILAVGVNAVATESDIISITTQIASVANIAGFSASELVGFSSALASVGTRPELARGTFTRLFTEIQQSVAAGGDQLDAFARTAGQSVDQFTQAWGEGSGAEQVIAILRGLNAEGKTADQTLAQLGITSVRDVPTLLKLAQSVEEVEKQIQIANIGFIEGVELQKQYSVITSTFSEKIEVLKNNFAALAAQVGSATGPLTVLVDILIGISKAFESILDNPINSFIVGTIGVLGALTGALTLLGALLVRGIGGLVGFATASIEGLESIGLFKVSMDQASGSLVANTNATEANTVAKVKNAGATRSSTAAEIADKAATDANTVSKAGFFSTLFQGTKQTKLFSTTVAGLAVTLGSVVVLGLIEYFYNMATATDEASDNVKKLDDVLSDSSSIMRAVEQDTKNFNSAVGEAKKDFVTFNAEVRNTNTSLSEQGKIIAAVTGQADLYVTSAEDGTTALKDQTFAVGENTKEIIKQELALKLLTDANEKLFDIEQARLAQQKVSISQNRIATKQAAFDAGEAYTAYGTLSAESFRTGEDERAVEALREQSTSALLAVIRDPRLITGLQESGFDIAEWADAVASGNTIVANSIASDLAPSLEDLATKLENQNAELFAEEIEMLNFAAQNGIGALSDYSSFGEELITMLKEAAFEQAIFGDTLAETTDDAEEFKDALKGTFDEAYAQINAERQLEDAVNSLGAAFVNNEASVVASGTEIQKVIQSIIETSANTEDSVNGLSSLYTALIDGGYASADQLVILRDQIVGLQRDILNTRLEAALLERQQSNQLNALLSSAGPESGLQFRELKDKNLRPIREIRDEIALLEQQLAGLDEYEIVGSESVELAGQLAQAYQEAEEAASGAADSAGDMKEAVRTLLDYANDLESVFSRAFDLRFADMQSIDRIADSWESFADQVESATGSIEELQAAQQSLSADRAIKEYFLSVAESYDDQLRAGKLRAEIAELDKEQVDAAEELADAQKKAAEANDLTGLGPGARQNRQALLGLVRDYQDYIGVLAESGASQDELRRATEEARQEFIRQATELGFAESDVMMYASAFDDVRTAIDRVPRDVTVDFNADPALQALNELNAKLDQSIEKAKELNRQQRIEPDLPAPTGPTAFVPSDAAERARLGARPDQSVINGRLVGGSGSPAGETEIQANRVTINTDLSYLLGATGSFSSGGFTGRGGRMDPAGIVHKGEYVIPKEYVNQSTGMPDSSFLAQLQNGVRGYQMGGFVGGAPSGTSMVELSPADRNLLRSIGGSGDVVVSVDSREIARAANKGNRSIVSEGGRP